MQAVDWFTLDVTITPPSSLSADPEKLTGKKWQPDALIIVSADRDNSPLPDFMGGLANLAGGGISIAMLVYAGGIDDGNTMDPKKVLAAHSYVRPALEDILAGKAVRVATTEPFGCALAYAG